MMIVFALCVAILVAIAKLFGISYEEASVIVNLCIQPALLVISSFALFVCRIKKRSGIIASFCYLILNIFAMVKLFMHYKVWDIDVAFKKCVNELEFLASKIMWLFPQKDPYMKEPYIYRSTRLYFGIYDSERNNICDFVSICTIFEQKTC